ncbi:MAG: ABC transporter permease, partial [Lachnospiraceae bacterium]|nr:ABC transporter permease [Lachnospiraceae bacterium]
LNVGDSIIINYIDKIEYINKKTGIVYADVDMIPDEELLCINVKREEHEEEYKVVAKVEDTGALGYRYYAGENFIVSSDELLANISDAAALYYIMDVADEAEAEIEAFIAQYTENSMLDYESKVTMAAEFDAFKDMFLILGSALSFVVALVGLLNFINIVLTGIISRRKELATLQAIGMTGGQLRTMLIYEGLLYTAGAMGVSVVLNLLTIPMSTVLEELFWFCEYEFTMLPLLIAIPVFVGMGIIVPSITYMIFVKKTIVERLRETE